MSKKVSTAFQPHRYARARGKRVWCVLSAPTEARKWPQSPRPPNRQLLNPLNLQRRPRQRRHQRMNSHRKSRQLSPSRCPQDATWSDGTALTSKDLVGTWDILWVRKSGTWDSLADVVAKDDQTVQFQIITPGPAVLDAIVRSNSPRPYSQYGKWMDAATKFRASGADRDGPEVTALNEELNAFTPEEGVVYGPYNIDPASVTEAQLSFVKVATGFNADQD